MNPTTNKTKSAPPREIQTTLQVVLNNLPSPASKRLYRMSLRDFTSYWLDQDCPVPDKLFLQTYLFALQQRGVGASSINLRLAAVKCFAQEAADQGIWPGSVPKAFSRVKPLPQRGTRSGNWLTLAQAQRLIDAPDTSTLKGLRDRAILAMLLGCGLRRAEVVPLTLAHLQPRGSAWVLANIVGKRSKVRTVVVPDWCKKALDEYTHEAGITAGVLFRPARKDGVLLDGGICTKTIARVVKAYAAAASLPEISPLDLRRTYAKLSFKNGARLDQIQINLGHGSLATTQRYLGVNLDLHDGPGNYVKIEA